MKKLSIYSIYIALLLSSCKEKKDIELVVDTPKNKIIQLTSKDVNSEGIFLFTSEKQQLISWTEHGKNKKEAVLKCAFFNPKTNVFGKPNTINTSKGLQIHAESMAKVGITKKGILYAVFRMKSKDSKSIFGGTVYYTISTDKGTSWSEKQQLVNDISSTSQSFFDITQLTDGELGISWLDNRKLHKNRQGQTLYFAKTDASNTFKNEIALEGSVCQCCRTDIEVNKNGTIQIAFRNLISSGEFGFPSTLTDQNTEIRDIYYTISNDHGKTFSKSSTLYADNWQVNGCPHTGPSIASNTNEFGAVWFTDAKRNSGVFFNTKITNNTYNDKKLVSKTGSHPQMVSTNGNYYIVYEEYYEANKKGYTKIILQKRDTNSLLETIEISAPKTNNDHAVIKVINANQLLISWVNTDTRNAVVQYLVYYL